MKGILDYTETRIVSNRVIGTRTRRSSPGVDDGDRSAAWPGISWYDNEWGYSNPASSSPAGALPSG